MVLLGSTGSIGTATLSVAREFHLRVETLVAGRNTDQLNAQIAEFRPKRVVVADREAAAKVNFDGVQYGAERIVEAVRESESDLVVNALVGFAGLAPTAAALGCGKRLALANKESLVCAGAFVSAERITPIDSEHFGVQYLISGTEAKIARLIITASGGALRDTPIEAIENAGLTQVLKHPNWSMGAKITIDSATMINKLFEVLEARWLFGAHEIDALIERSSVIHAMIEFADGCIKAHACKNDMRLAIANAVCGVLSEPLAGRLELCDLAAIKFEPISAARYPAWQIKDALLQTPALGVVINAANDVAVARFRAGAISFGVIARTVLAAFERFSTPPKSLDEAIELHKEAEAWARNF